MNIQAGTIYDEAALGGSVGDNYEASIPDFLARCSDEAAWLNNRLAFGLDNYQSFTTGISGTEICRGPRNGKAVSGVNFGSQDYLSLSAHPELIQAAKEVADDYGVHSAGSAVLAGNLDISLQLEQELSDFLNYQDTTLFPIGWAAGYGVITGLVLPSDHVVIDQLAHACLQEGARKATTNVHTFPHLSNDGVERRLKRIRESNQNSGILVVSETLFSMDSDTPDIAELQKLCHAHGATLLVDCAHDLGAMGPTGRGLLEVQGMVGKVDLLMGAFSKSFASIGGFVASNETGLKNRLRTACGPSTFTNAMTPIQVGVLRRALQIIASDEGSLRREQLARNVTYVRDQLTKAGFEVMGNPSAIIPVILSSPGASRIATKLCNERGVFVNLVEYPAVAKNRCRWRIQMQADHTLEQIDEFVETARATKET